MFLSSDDFSTLTSSDSIFVISSISVTSKRSTLLSFTDNAHDYFLKGNLLQRRKIMEIISEEITYKDKNFDIKLKPIFQTIVEN